MLTTCREITQGAISDGLSFGSDVATPYGARCHKVALVVAPDRDFHSYQLDQNGLWSHKPATNPANNLDNSNNLINDPRTADRGPYTLFCGFLCVCCRQVTIG